MSIERSTSHTRPVADPFEIKIEKFRTRQIVVILESCYTFYFSQSMDGPEIVPSIFLQSCSYLDRLNQHLRSEGCPHPIQIAIGCVYAAFKFWADGIFQIKIQKVLNTFRCYDSTLTSDSLSSILLWTLDKLKYNLWNGPGQYDPTRFSLQLDPDWETRTLQELGFLSEQAFYPPSMLLGKIHDFWTVRKYIQLHDYKEILCRLREFCDDPKRFATKYFVKD